MSTPAAIADKIETLRALEQRQKFGTIIEPGAPLPELPGLPAGVSEVFSLFRRLEGSNFRFEPPPEITSLEAWTSRTHEEDGPLGDWLNIGYELYSVPKIARQDGLTGEAIRMHTERGNVYFIESDEYVSLYKDPDWGGAQIEQIAPDVVTFFDQYVLGEKYPQLVAAVIGPGMAGARTKKGAYQDTWMRLLAAAGLLS